MLDQNYWENRYLEGSTPWDMGAPAPALTAYLEDLDRNVSLLIPGAGRAWEAHWLEQKGFNSIKVIDLSPEALELAKAAGSSASIIEWIEGDFFAHQGQYDYIVEQTFFCALHPSLRPAYAAHMRRLLKPGGRLFGLLFNFPLTEMGPPFGGSEAEYRNLFEGLFKIKHLEPCYNSIKPRAGREFFLELIA